eukprot:TRINITY_DN6413_c0_g1_i1.p1 TRINITY_DN6413_c0_g1~~TRINITY_DN6413_c0_g1_i1.p1  ORF type:complete len:221 (-),score=24.96 TRINITY_DN6413_c0_g1_i1:313-975(-)
MGTMYYHENIRTIQFCFVSMKTFIIVVVCYLFAVLASAESGDERGAYYDKCDPAWAREVIFGYNGTGCVPAPGCKFMCPRVCWRGSVEICRGQYGHLLALVASVLTIEKIPCDAMPCTPGALNKYLNVKNGYESRVIVDLARLASLGLRLKLVDRTTNLKQLDQAAKRGRYVFLNIGKYVLLDDIEEKGSNIRVKAITGRGLPTVVDPSDIKMGFILDKI